MKVWLWTVGDYGRVEGIGLKSRNREPKVLIICEDGQDTRMMGESEVENDLWPRTLKEAELVGSSQVQVTWDEGTGGWKKQGF